MAPMIEYCVPGGLLYPALAIETPLLDESPKQIAEATVMTGTAGLSPVGLEGDSVYTNQREGPEPDANHLTEPIDGLLDVST